ncbi:SWI/SNF-related matrix-associated actin-dependent regulator of chromatin subfamily A member 1-like [Dermatophagoides farinae]|uniref:SWI/SNF-related matrix-associated actin-dependent regulator of chromatin subfamily A member 1-like n=1 Tax=Dermatophagoides farinae TaxID=6954 RepID=UPI003F64417F
MYNKAYKASKGKLLKEGTVLKDYQKLGVGWLLQSFFYRAGAVLADEMGLGKTIQCLTFLSALKFSGITGPHLIVVPLSTVGNWAREVRRFVPHLKLVKLCGSKFERDHIMNDPVASQGLHDLYITTYETAVTEESFFCDNFDWQCLILDEAHRIKNESGRIRHSLDRVCATMRVLLTGTPLQNNINELITLLNFLFPDVLKDSDQFEKMFLKDYFGSIKDLNTNNNVDNFIDNKVVESVSHLLKQMMLRRTKDLVVKLPRKIEHEIWLPLSNTGANWYAKLLEIGEAAFQTNSVRKILGAVIKMRICTCHPRCLVSSKQQLSKLKEIFHVSNEEAELVEKALQLQQIQGDEHIQASSKLIVLDKLLMQLHIQNHKVLIFTQFQLFAT